ncbi:hypothetical protein CRI94_16420 [Longibacter salinarum]|uniref:Uncharacterized protein n=1 Tax=Longibacter salinarum TaxID=1850348 RepID=A0A2A8CTW8_9BACT|nr:hypothetical protein [Longibacter salinarum]PEN11174.1 hypothetical protein CRI94_16420 [Longibacter salinarum]
MEKLAGALFFLVLLFGALIVIFLVARELVTWYWKINDILSTLKSINRRLALLVNEASPEARPDRDAKTTDEPPSDGRVDSNEKSTEGDEVKQCRYCKEETPKDDDMCQVCGSYIG